MYLGLRGLRRGSTALKLIVVVYSMGLGDHTGAGTGSCQLLWSREDLHSLLRCEPNVNTNQNSTAQSN